MSDIQVVKLNVCVSAGGKDLPKTTSARQSYGRFDDEGDCTSAPTTTNGLDLSLAISHTGPDGAQQPFGPGCIPCSTANGASQLARGLFVGKPRVVAKALRSSGAGRR